MSGMTEEMKMWLSTNREEYEFYLLHAMMHDSLIRTSLLATPVEPDDFRREEYALVVGALASAVKIMNVLAREVPRPPSVEFMRTYVESAARKEGSDRESVEMALRLVDALQNPAYREHHYCVGPYFEAWYGATRAKRVARLIQMEDVPDVHAQISRVQAALSAAQQAASSNEEDLMDGFLNGQDMERKMRRSTGIPGLDECLNGGWGDTECYLLFGGTGAGKSIAAGQCAWHEAHANDGWPLIVSTELFPREYAVRTVANAASVDISKLQDCENIPQLRQAVCNDPGITYRLPQVDAVLDTIRSRLRIHKISADEGMDARVILEREVMKYTDKMGRPPTWVCLDWLGSVADLGGTRGGSAERAAAWEMAATGCVKFAETSGLPTVVLAQAVNDAQLKSTLVINDIGIAKGIGKNMTVVVGVTNCIDKQGMAMAFKGEAEMPKSMIKDDQFFCVCKARKGEGRNVPVTRRFRYQRFEAKIRK